jgi:hypothetical protein
VRFSRRRHDHANGFLAARALPDGTVFFLDEPIPNVAAPLLQVDPRLMLHFQSLIASKARLMAARAAHL